MDGKIGDSGGRVFGDSFYGRTAVKGLRGSTKLAETSQTSTRTPVEWRPWQPRSAASPETRTAVYALTFFTEPTMPYARSQTSQDEQGLSKSGRCLDDCQKTASWWSSLGQDKLRPPSGADHDTDRPCQLEPQKTRPNKAEPSGKRRWNLQLAS